MSFNFITRDSLLVPTGEDCKTCNGTGKNPKKRKQYCPVKDCQDGKMWKLPDGVEDPSGFL